MMQPDVSVIVAAWKAVDVVERAVRSALQSRGVTVEVIVVDDASPDGTFPLLRQLATHEPRLLIDQLPTNAGPAAARNRAIARATARFIAVVDADDEIEPDRLARLVALAERRKADIVVDNMKEVDERGRPLASSLFLRSPAFAAQRTIDLETWVAFNHPMKRGECLGYLKPMIRKATLNRLRVAYDPALRNSEDYYLIADLLAQGARMIYTPEPGYRYTRSSASTSHRLKPEQTRAWLDAEARYLRRHEGALSAGQQLALSRRSRTLRHVSQLVAATDAVKARRIGALARLLVADLESSAYTLTTFAKVAGHKLLRRTMS
jgi:succinoglycan biosynthesis protein ExoO